MSRYLNKGGFAYLLNQLEKRFVKKGEFLLIAPKIRYEYTDNKRISIMDAETNQYIIITPEIKYLQVGPIINLLNEHKSNKLYIQFYTSNDEDLDIKFDDLILWKDGIPINLESNKLYRIEITGGNEIFTGSWNVW